MAYINPSSPDGDDDRLRKHHVDIEHERIMHGGDPHDSLDRSIRLSKRSWVPNIPAGWSPIRGMARSGAMDPSARSRLERQETDGLIEILRDDQRRPYAWREARSEGDG